MAVGMNTDMKRGFTGKTLFELQLVRTVDIWYNMR